jgi:uncharacterized protein (TIGR03083 family)
MTIWDNVADERRRLADELEDLTETQWSTPSLCDGWTVKDTAAHLTTTFHTSMPKFMLKVITSGGFNRANAKIAVAEASQRSTSDIVNELRANAEHRFTPPGLGPEAPLLDVVVHGRDIGRPLGLSRTLPPEVAEQVLEFLMTKKAKVVHPKGGIADLRFEATDIDWSGGDGAVVSGPAEALLMAVSGRPAALDDLNGDGLAELTSRF